ELLQGHTVRGHAQHRCVAHLPSLGRGHGLEAALHLETLPLVVPPPAGEEGKTMAQIYLRKVSCKGPCGGWIRFAQGPLVPLASPKASRRRSRETLRGFE